MKHSIYHCFYLIFLSITVGLACNPKELPMQNPIEKQVRATAKDYFDTFSERRDWDKLCSFYREDVHFKDVLLQLELDSLWRFKRFYKWDEEGDRFRKLSPDQKHLDVQSLVVEEYTATARGRVNPFYYDGQLIDSEWGMEFTIWLKFDANFKIIEQIDWMEYDPDTQESTIQRCRENGHEAIPDWLDLSRKELLN